MTQRLKNSEVILDFLRSHLIEDRLGEWDRFKSFKSGEHRRRPFLAAADKRAKDPDSDKSLSASQKPRP